MANFVRYVASLIQWLLNPSASHGSNYKGISICENWGFTVIVIHAVPTLEYYSRKKDFIQIWYYVQPIPKKK